MGVLGRLSDGFWSYVSPRKPIDTPHPTPSTAPHFKKPVAPTRGGVFLHDLAGRTQSMSPVTRVQSWHFRSPSTQDTGSLVVGRRKRGSTTTEESSHGYKRIKLEQPDEVEDDEKAADEEYGTQSERSVDSDVEEEDANEDEDEDKSMDDEEAEQTYDNNDRLEIDGVDAVVLSTAEYALSTASGTPPKRKPITIPEELNLRHVSTSDLRAQGRDDDYITLLQKIAMRGYEPLLPAYFYFDYRFLPDGLFETHNDAFIASVKGNHVRAIKALERLFELGGRIRDRVELKSTVQPEQEVRKHMTEYLAWADADAADLVDTRTAIPLLAMVFQPLETPSHVIRRNATAKCAGLAARYREALRVQRSVEMSPVSNSSNTTYLSYPIPTLYAVVASHTVVALMAYQPKESSRDGADEPECTPMAYFDFRSKDYDVWNSLALAMVVCHVRNVRMRVAEETGLGLRIPGGAEDEQSEDSDPDA